MVLHLQGRHTCISDCLNNGSVDLYPMILLTSQCTWWIGHFLFTLSLSSVVFYHVFKVISVVISFSVPIVEEQFCFILPELQTMHTLYPCQTTQNQYKYKNHSKHGNNVYITSNPTYGLETPLRPC